MMVILSSRWWWWWWWWWWWRWYTRIVSLNPCFFSSPVRFFINCKPRFFAAFLRWHPYWMWMRDTHDPDYPEFYLPKPGHPHLHYKDRSIFSDGNTPENLTAGSHFYGWFGRWFGTLFKHQSCLSNFELSGIIHYFTCLCSFYCPYSPH